MKYDIFISYRRSSYDTANLIATKLKAAGYRVFFDMETLRSGKFNEQLYAVIEQCTDFIVVLPENALDRCVSPEDWVRKEVCHAMLHKKNIVPVMLYGFDWPSPMPKGMEELKNYQAVTASSNNLFDMAMRDMQERYILSRRHVSMKKILLWVSVVLISLVVVSALAFGYFRVTAKNVCEKYAMILTNHTSMVHLVADENRRVEESWSGFIDDMMKSRNVNRREVLCREMSDRLDFHLQNIERAVKIDPTPLVISAYDSFLLSLHGINSEEIAMTPAFVDLYVQDFHGQIASLKQLIEDGSLNELERLLAQTIIGVTTHTINSYYAGYLSILSIMPSSAHKSYNQLAKQWSAFPEGYGLGMEQSYYENIIFVESKRADDLLTKYEAMLEQSSVKMDAISESIDEEYIDEITTDDMINDLAVRQQTVETKRELVAAKRAELEELDRKYLEAYDTLKNECLLNEEDGQWYKWGKIARWANMLGMVAESRRLLEEQGIRSSSSVTPEVAYADMVSLLSSYESYHPESKAYVPAVKLFYKEVARENRPLAGVLVIAFKDNAQHEVFKVGDIIVEFNGTAIKNLSELKSSNKRAEDGSVSLLRLIDGELKALAFPSHGSTDNVGFIDLMQN